MADTFGKDPRLNLLNVISHESYYSEHGFLMRDLILGLGVLVARIMGLGAIFATLFTMFSAIQIRKREMAMLKAMGFGFFPTVVAVLLEAMLFALISGIMGGLIAWLLIDGFRAATFNLASFSQVAFAFDVNANLVAVGIAYALCIGLFGGLIPVWRIHKQPQNTCLREP